ncbi:hypothetical protein MRX96_042944 [Rhipicephalus microplus]
MATLSHLFDFYRNARGSPLEKILTHAGLWTRSAARVSSALTCVHIGELLRCVQFGVVEDEECLCSLALLALVDRPSTGTAATHGRTRTSTRWLPRRRGLLLLLISAALYFGSRNTLPQRQVFGSRAGVCTQSAQLELACKQSGFRRPQPSIRKEYLVLH